MCPRRYEIMHCVDHLIDLLSPCVDPKTISIDGMKNALKSIVEYICVDHARVAKQLYDDGIASCTDIKNVTYFHGCLDKFYSIHTNNAQVLACSKYDVVKDCVENFFKECDKPTIADLVNNVVYMWYKSSNCNPDPE
ncbi:hypothetical protein ACJJTC_008792 [Scirpophaga incertulas]